MTELAQHTRDYEIVEGEVLPPNDIASWDPLAAFTAKDDSAHDVPLQAGGGAWR